MPVFDVLSMLDASISEVATQLAPVWDDFLLVEVPLEEDSEGIRHNLSRSSRCRPPQRIVVVPLLDLINGERLCPLCCIPQLEPMGQIGQLVALRTVSLRLAIAPDAIDPSVRAQAMVRAIWSGASRFCPPPVFKRLRHEVLLPGINKLGASLRPHDTAVPGSLVAFTLGDMRLGPDEDPGHYDLWVKAAAPALVHASPGDGVWLLHSAEHYVPALARTWMSLGTMLSEKCLRDDIDLQACEVFGVLCDDAVAGSGDYWSDVKDWWVAAQLLSTQRAR